MADQKQPEDWVPTPGDWVDVLDSGLYFMAKVKAIDKADKTATVEWYSGQWSNSTVRFSEMSPAGTHLDTGKVRMGERISKSYVRFWAEEQLACHKAVPVTPSGRPELVMWDQKLERGVFPQSIHGEKGTEWVICGEKKRTGYLIATTAHECPDTIGIFLVPRMGDPRFVPFVDGSTAGFTISKNDLPVQFASVKRGYFDRTELVNFSEKRAYFESGGVNGGLWAQVGKQESALLDYCFYYGDQKSLDSGCIRVHSVVMALVSPVIQKQIESKIGADCKDPKSWTITDPDMNKHGLLAALFHCYGVSGRAPVIDARSALAGDRLLCELQIAFVGAVGKDAVAKFHPTLIDFAKLLEPSVLRPAIAHARQTENGDLLRVIEEWMSDHASDVMEALVPTPKSGPVVEPCD